MEDALRDALKPQSSILRPLNSHDTTVRLMVSTLLSRSDDLTICAYLPVFLPTFSYTQYTFCFQAKWHPALSSSPTLLSTYVVSINTRRCHQTSQLFISTLFNLCIQVCVFKAFCIVLFCCYVGYLMVFVFPMFYYCICCIFLGLYKVLFVCFQCMGERPFD